MAQIENAPELTLPREHKHLPLRLRWAESIPAMAALAVDCIAIVLASVVATWGRSEWTIFEDRRDLDSHLVVATPLIVALWLVNLAASGAYSSHAFGCGSTEYKNVLRASGFAAGSVGIACYLSQVQLSRGFFFLLFIVGVPTLVLGRHGARKALHVVHRRGQLQHSVIIAGAADQVDEIASVLLRERWLGFSVLGALLPKPPALPSETPHGLKVLGATSQTVDLVTTLGADFVIFAGGAVNSCREMRRAAWELEDSKVRVLLAPSLTDVAADRIHPHPAAGLPLIELDGPGAHIASRLLKRTFDLVVAGWLTLLFLPVIAVISLMIKVQDGGPVFFVQQRVGRNGTHFGVFKFRSMIVDAEARLREVASQNLHVEGHVLFKAVNDPRVTRLGRLLRRLSLDELPQLLNVLRGDMSLVGPRPPLQSEVDRYDPDVHRRLAVRPGMTGLWQVSGRSDLSWEDSVRLDLYYVDNWSLAQDLVILAHTARAVVASRGAY